MGLNMLPMKFRFGLEFFQVILSIHKLLKNGKILRPHLVHLFYGLLPIEVIFLEKLSLPRRLVFMLPPQLLIQFHDLLFLEVEPLKVNSVVDQAFVDVIGVDGQDGFDLGFLTKPRGVNVSDALKNLLEEIKLFRVIFLEQN